MAQNRALPALSVQHLCDAVIRPGLWIEGLDCSAFGYKAPEAFIFYCIHPLASARQEGRRAHERLERLSLLWASRSRAVLLQLSGKGLAVVLFPPCGPALPSALS